MEYKLAHIGINTESATDAADLANTLCAMFDLAPRHGEKSEFAGSLVECLKTPYLGKHGHIALKTEDLEAAVADLKAKGYSFNMDTAAYTENGKLKNIYLDGEFGGDRLVASTSTLKHAVKIILKEDFNLHCK